MNLVQIAPDEWELPRRGAMRVPGRVLASEQLLEAPEADSCLAQVANVACLPGLVGAPLAMPDVHSGHGFPVGCVAAFDAHTGVIAPAGVGFDINCGVRLLSVRGVRLKKAREHRGEIAKALLKAIPTGAGRGGALQLKAHELDQVARAGAVWAIEREYGTSADLECVEEGGCAPWAEPRHVTADARIRGAPQLGTLGSGGHFLEMSVVSEVLDEPAAQALGLGQNVLTVLIHTGSRGFGHQVTADFLERMLPASARHGIELPDPELACAPFASDEGQAYFGALGAAMNFAFANRQVITHRVREVLTKAFGELEVRVVYDAGHNGVKFERHAVGGVERELVVHRKGATRALGPAHADLPSVYRDLGLPVFVPGGMGRPSFVLLGTHAAELRTFGSCCHGAGRVIDRARARELARGRDVARELARRGISLQAANPATPAEDLGEAHKEVSAVIDVVARAGLARAVAKLEPFVVVKG